MNDRLLTLARTQILIAAAGIAIAFPLTGCSARSAASDASGGAQSSAGADSTANGGGSPTAGRRRFAHILASLGLSDEQKRQIKALVTAARKQSAGADLATRRANMKAAYAKIETLLTPDQRVKMDAMLRGRTERDQSAPSQS